MSIGDALKSKKNVIILAVAAVVLAVVVVIQLMPSGEERPIGPPVIARKARIAPPDEAAKTQAPAQPSAPAGAPPAAAPPEKMAGIKPAAPAKPAAVEEKKPAIKIEAPDKAPAVAVAKKPAEAKKAVSKKGSKRWAVHVSSMTYENEARHFASKLKKAGYNAYVTEFTKDDVQWYRVRVGFYAGKAEAEKASRKIVAKFKVKTNPWLITAPKSEVSKYSK